ncbi:SDR family NAD(P)-dependent oxidoreductase [Pikeienuella sp. HZG-20]|uniref:SDR family NAD(P)-dependent oxidoreductase n=1 Tax=Paludibacillus litoralis TaxID=3133267 RepID=UPI0030EE6DA7
MNAYDLKGRKAIVTGGAQGIGRAISERFIASGATVTIWDVDREKAEAMCAETGASYVTPELTDWEAVQSAAARSNAEMGGIDILVCNAGVAGKNTTVADYPVEEWRRVLDINLNGVFYCCKAVSPIMAKAGYGRVVNIASIAGKEGNPNASAYSASKAGVIALTKSLGKELADKNVAVNCVTPAAAKTAIFDQMTEEHINFMLSKIPRGRFVKVEEIASLVGWLASEENSFTTGGVFDISGGRATY